MRATIAQPGRTAKALRDEMTLRRTPCRRAVSAARRGPDEAWQQASRTVAIRPEFLAEVLFECRILGPDAPPEQRHEQQHQRERQRAAEREHAARARERRAQVAGVADARVDAMRL